MSRRAAIPALAVLVAATAVHLTNFAVTGGAVRFLDSSWALSYSHVLATFGYAAGAAAGVTGMRTDPRRARAWGLLAVISLLLLGDHVTRAHDDVGAGAVVVVVALVLALAVVSVRLATRTDRAAVVAGGLALLAAAMVIHLALRRLAAVTPWEPHGYVFDWWFQVAVAVKEGAELAGWVLLAPALLHLAGVRLPLAWVTKTTARP